MGVHECNEESLLQRQQAAVWENLAQWTCLPSPSSMAESSSMKKRRLFWSARSRSAFTSSWTAWMRRSLSRGMGSSVVRRVRRSGCAALDACVCPSGLRWGGQRLSVWRTSWPLSLESTSGTSTKTTETPCWFIWISSEQPRTRWVDVFMWNEGFSALPCVDLCVFVFSSTRWLQWVLRRAQRPGGSWTARSFGFPSRVGTTPGWRLCAQPCWTVAGSGVRGCCCRDLCVWWVQSLNKTLLKSDFLLKYLVLNPADLLHLSPGDGGLLPETAAPHHSLHPSRRPQRFLEGAALHPHSGLFRLLFQKRSGGQSIRHATQLWLWWVQMRSKIIKTHLFMFFFTVTAHIWCFCDNYLFVQSPTLPAKACTTSGLCAPCSLLLTIWDTTRDH